VSCFSVPIDWSRRARPSSVPERLYVFIDVMGYGLAAYKSRSMSPSARVSSVVSLMLSVTQSMERAPSSPPRSVVPSSRRLVFCPVNPSTSLYRLVSSPSTPWCPSDVASVS